MLTLQSLIFLYLAFLKVSFAYIVPESQSLGPPLTLISLVPPKPTPANYNNYNAYFPPVKSHENFGNLGCNQLIGNIPYHNLCPMPYCHIGTTNIIVHNYNYVMCDPKKNSTMPISEKSEEKTEPKDTPEEEADPENVKTVEPEPPQKESSSIVFLPPRKVEKTEEKKENEDSVEKGMPKITVYINNSTLPYKAEEEENPSKARPQTYRRDSDDELLDLPGGVKITCNNFKKILFELDKDMDNVRLIVPKGHAGPLHRYFHHLEKEKVLDVIKNGVCRFSNGMLVPLKIVIPIMQFHRFAVNEYNKSLFSTNDHESKFNWIEVGDFCQLMKSLILSNKVFIIFPNKKRAPYLETRKRIPYMTPDQLKSMDVEMFGYKLPYLNFEKYLRHCFELKKRRGD